MRLMSVDIAYPLGQHFYLMNHPVKALERHCESMNEKMNSLSKSLHVSVTASCPDGTTF